jgi:hypothetical protein
MGPKKMIKQGHYIMRWGITCLALTVLFSCKTGKIITDKKMDESLTSRVIIRNHYKNQLNFRTLTSRLRIDYTDGESKQSVGVSLRMEKDKIIWLSAPLGIVKAMITPDRVTFYNKLQNEYFDGDFEYLSNLLGTDLDFKKLQNLLLGEALFDLRDERYDVSVNGSSYELKPKRAADLFKTLFNIEPNNFKMASQQISQPWKKRLLEIRYKDYQERNKNVVPNNVGIVAIDNDVRNIIDIEYRNVEFDNRISFPYRIPSGFDKIVLK